MFQPSSVVRFGNTVETSAFLALVAKLTKGSASIFGATLKNSSKLLATQTFREHIIIK